MPTKENIYSDTTGQFCYNPQTNENGDQIIIMKSPLSGKVIYRKNIDTGEEERFVCDVCKEYVESKKDTHVFDPIFFWAAGIFDYKSHVTPEGRKAYLNDESMANYIYYLPKETKQNWKEITGMHFPFLFMKNRQNG